MKYLIRHLLHGCICLTFQAHCETMVFAICNDSLITLYSIPILNLPPPPLLTTMTNCLVTGN